jgi:hypothetical protein
MFLLPKHKHAVSGPSRILVIKHSMWSVLGQQETKEKAENLSPLNEPNNVYLEGTKILI